MQTLPLLFIILGGSLLALGVLALVFHDKVPGRVLVAIGTSVIAVALGTNGFAMSRDTIPTDERGAVTLVKKTLEHGSVVTTLMINEKLYICKDGGGVECAGVNPGESLGGKKWTVDGMTWFFLIETRAAR